MAATRQRRNPVTGWWEKVPEPASDSVLITIAYCLMCVAGISALIDPPRSVYVAFPSQFLIVYWAALLAVGGFSAAISVLPGAYWLERVGSSALALGLVMYVITTLSFHHPGEDNRIPHMLTIITLLVLVGTRWARIWKDFRDPEKSSTYQPR